MEQPEEIVFISFFLTEYEMLFVCIPLFLSSIFISLNPRLSGGKHTAYMGVQALSSLNNE